MAIYVPDGTTHGRSEGGITTGGNVTVAEPVEARPGNVLIAMSVCDLAGAIVAPSGWTVLYTGANTASMFNVAWIQRVDTPLTTAQRTWTITGSVYREVYLVCLQADQFITINAQSATGAITASTNVGSNPGPATMTAPNGMSVCFGYNYGSSTGSWVCTGYTRQTSGTAGEDAALFTKSLSTAGVEDPPLWTITSSGSNNQWDGGTVIFTDVQLPSPSNTSSPAVIRKTVPKTQRLDDA